MRRRPLLIFVTASISFLMLLMTAPIASAGTSVNGEITSVLIAGRERPSAVAVQEGSSLKYVFTGHDVDVRIEKAVGNLWVHVKSVHVGQTVSVPVKVGLTVPIDSVYRKTVRNQKFRYVLTGPNGASIIGKSVVTVRVFKRPYAPSTAYRSRWSKVSGTSNVWRWNPCKIITYRVDARYAPRSNATALSDVKKAVSAVGRASGLTFKYVGSVKTTASNQYSSANLTFRWANIGKNIAGQASTHSTYVAAGAPFMAITRGSTRISPTYDRSSERRRVIVMHETLHMIGLGHSKNRADIMSSSGNHRGSFGLGDKVGMRVVGAQAGCY